MIAAARRLGRTAVGNRLAVRWRRWAARRASAREEQAGVDQWQWGYAIRLDWPDGTHDLFSHHVYPEAAARRLRRNQRYWRTGVARPRAWTVVVATRDDVRRHPSSCTSPRCAAQPALPGPS